MSARHSLAWLTPQGWCSAIAGVTPALRPALQSWQRQDWPVVVRRADLDARDSELCVGIALPPDAQGEKQRIPFKVDATGVHRMRAPLQLDEALCAAPASWQTPLQALFLEAQAQGLDLRVYGSLPLQALTGLDYLRSTSDIDLLFQPVDRTQLDAGMALLARYAHQLPLDGEVVLDGDGAVTWKEWLHAGRAGKRVLVKRGREVRLQRADTLLAGFDAVSSAASVSGGETCKA